MFKRILIVASCVALLVCAMVLPASAAVLDYDEYIDNVVVDGANDLVTCSFPVNRFQFGVYDEDGLIEQFTASSFDYTFQPGVTYDFELFPRDYIGLSVIPDDTQVQVTFKVNKQHGFLDFSQASEYAAFTYSSGDWQTVDVEEVENSYVISGAIQKNGSSYFRPFYSFSKFSTTYDSPVNFSLDVVSYKVVMRISSLYRLQQQQQETNKILTAVEEQLKEQGLTLDEVLQQQQQTNDKLDDTNNKLDDIINGTVSPSTPNGSDAVGDLDDAEQGLRDDAQTGLNEGLQIQQSALDVVLQYASAFACVGWIFNSFANIPFFSGILYVSLALGVFGAILGVGLYISRSYAGSRAGKGKGG